MFKVLFKILLAIGAVFAAFTAFQYFTKQKSDYIEIYNDDGLDEEYF